MARLEKTKRWPSGANYTTPARTSETRNVAAGNSEIVRRLETLAVRTREDLGDKLTSRTGKGVRRPGRATDSAP